MLRPRSSQVQPGDRFTKATGPHGKAWEVVDLWTAVDGIVHARLRSCDARGSLITIAAGVLTDPGYWRAVRDTQ